MNKHDTSPISLVIETPPELPSFLSDKVDLKRLSKELNRASGQAVGVLVAAMGSKDERVRLDAAKRVLDFQVQVAKEISTDQMQRLIAEIRLVRSPKQKLVGAPPGAQQDRVIVDFSNIRQLE